MNIKLKANADLHWWGKSLLIILNAKQYYILNNEEQYLVKKMSNINNIEMLISNISAELNVSPKVVEEFIYTFMKNFSEFFFFASDDLASKLSISGEYNKYYPIELHLSLTNCCIQHCKHCYKSAGFEGIFINEDKLFNFLDNMKGYTKYLNISGGEPTIHPSFDRLIERYSKDYQICVLSSGITIMQFLESLKKASRGIVVSLYSRDPKTHDAFVEFKGSYQRIMDGVRLALSMNIPVSVTTLLFRSNLDDIKALIEELIAIGVKNISVGSISEIGRARESGLIQNMSLEKTHEQMKLLKETYPQVSVLDEAQPTGDSKLSFAPFNCTAGSLSWAVFEDGDIQPCGVCPISKFSLGNIAMFNNDILSSRTGYLQNVVNSEEYKRMVQNHSNCPFVFQSERI